MHVLKPIAKISFLMSFRVPVLQLLLPGGIPRYFLFPVGYIACLVKNGEQMMLYMET